MTDVLPEDCPTCGGRRRDVHLQGSVALSVGATFSATVQIGYQAQSPWQQKWINIEYQLRNLDELYAGQPTPSNITVLVLIEGLFKSCRELADWLWEDPLTTLTKPTVVQFVHGNQYLKIADGLAQTSKHNRRSGPTKMVPDPITAWVEHINPGASQIRWISHSGTIQGTADALQLARDCVAAWQAFLSARGML